jgi:hypothetical protein
MIESSTDQSAASALQAAVDSLDVAVEHLIKLVDDGALGAFGLVDMLHALERERRPGRLPAPKAAEHRRHHGHARHQTEQDDGARPLPDAA